MAAGIALLGSAAETPSPAAAPSSSLPSAADVIAKHLKATGGREATLKHTATRFKGDWEMAGQGAGGEFETIQAKPNKRLMRFKLTTGGEIVNAFDGKVGWITSPFAEPALMEGKLLAQTREDAEYYAILHNAADFQSMETVGRTQFDNRDCVELKLVRKSGRVVHEYYDAATGFLAGARGMQETQQGPSEITITCQGYQKFGDLFQATQLKIDSDQGNITIRIKSVAYDSVSDTEFEPPAEIKALLKRP
jgi:outer membrane lipoprotein-sorting protein